MKTDPLYYSREPKPMCPHCGEAFEVWDGDNPHSLNYEDGGHTTFDCKSCRKEFVCVTVVEFSFSTAISEDAADDEEWGPQEDADADTTT